MKLLVVLVALTAVCGSSAIPAVPRDNSHYVEGKSRYIWMPDGDGTPVLVDLHAPVEEDFNVSRNGARNQYWLFTRNNRSNRQTLIVGDANSIRNSNYNGNLPTMVIAHGWRSNGGTGWVNRIRDAYLDWTNANVIVVDWSADASNILYPVVAQIVPQVGQRVKEFLNFLISTGGGNYNRIHLVGHSLGAHVMGNAGRAPGGLPVRVTGLDPAGPNFASSSNALNANFGTYVESIHTHRTLGISRDISNADFFPNGGTNQPGCGDMNCDHGRAAEFFAASIGRSHLVGRRCSNLQQAHSNQCTGTNLVLGNADLAKRGSGIYALTTGSSWPY